MRIVQLIDSLHIGGAEKLQMTFMQMALLRGLKPTLITFNRHAEGHFFKQLKSLGIQIIEVKGRNLFDPMLLGKLIEILRSEKFDVLHAHLTYSIILGGLAGWLTGIPVVASIHNLKPDSWAFFELMALKFLTNRSIAVGYSVAKTRQSKFVDFPIDVIPNPVEPLQPLSSAQILELRKLVATDPSRFLLITVGRLLEAKGYDDMLDAVDRLRHSHPQTLLLIVGAGEYLDGIKAKIKFLELDEHVRLLGARSDVPNLLMASDLYVSASHWEGLPISILEAMAAGLSVVATSVGDIPRVVKPQFGICVPAHQPDQLAAALRLLVENPEQRTQFGNAARQYVADSHSARLWFDQTLTVYERVISDANRIHGKE